MANPWDPAWSVQKPPEPKWEWDIFGNRELVINIMKDVSWSRRLKTSLVLKSKWKKIK
jgi:hypothetical protein